MRPNLQAISASVSDSIRIKQALLARRLSVTGLAKKIRRSRVATSGGIHNAARFPKARALIEEVLREG